MTANGSLTLPRRSVAGRGAIVAGVVAVVILFFSIECFLTNADCCRRANAAQTAEPIHLKVDLSKPGAYTGEFRHTFATACVDVLKIATDPPFESKRKPRRVSRG